MKPEEIAWSKNLMQQIRVGGVWSVPRSGLIFTKRSETHLVLTVSMPWTDEMKTAHAAGADVPSSEEALKQYQQNDYETIAARFTAAGFTVTDERKSK